MNDFERVKDAIPFRDYAASHLTIKGHKALCLFHADNHPSMHIYADSYHCFQCGASGDIFDLYMRINNCDKQTALIELARYARVDLTPLTGDAQAKQDKRERLYALLDASAAYYQAYLTGEAMTYLTEARGYTFDTIKAARLGYAPFTGLVKHLTSLCFMAQEIEAAGMAVMRDDGQCVERFRNRIMIPIRDDKGRVLAFSGRALSKDQQPKYLYNTGFEKAKNIHRMPSNKAAGASDAWVVVEGSLDPISAANRGIYNVVSQMGTSLSDEQLTLLCKGVSKLIFCLDNDKAGHEALRRLVKEHMHRAADSGVSLYTMSAPHGKDPDDTFREHPEMWQAAVDAARPAIVAFIERETASLTEHSGSVEKIAIAKRLMPLLKGSNPLVSEDSIALLSQALGYTSDQLKAWVEAQIQIVPRHVSPVPTASLNVTETELKVLHGILVNDDQRWIDRANANLARLADFPNALQPLSMNDFTSNPARDLMACIVQGSKGDRPFDSYVLENVGTGPLSEVYQRSVYQPVVSAIVNVNTALAIAPLEWREFMKMVCRLRYMRLKSDVARRLITGIDLAEWIRASHVLEMYL